MLITSNAASELAKYIPSSDVEAFLQIRFSCFFLYSFLYSHGEKCFQKFTLEFIQFIVCKLAIRNCRLCSPQSSYVRIYLAYKNLGEIAFIYFELYTQLQVIKNNN